MTLTHKLLITLLALGTVLTASAHAHATDKKQPLVITADGALEWHRDQKFYLARGNAIAKQNDAELHGQTLRADYADKNKNGALSISRIDATGNVLVISGGAKARGDEGFYNLKTGVAELTGKNLRLITPTDTVTARDKLTYNAPRQEMRAIGAARAVRDDDIITADTLIGRFSDDPTTGQSKLNELEAKGHVVITTPNDILYGDHGLYDTITNKAIITGNVRIERGPNIITGARGEIDLDTNISRIFGAAELPAANTSQDPDAAGVPATRVRGVFFPE